jgi:hypothetical protein
VLSFNPALSSALTGQITLFFQLLYEASFFHESLRMGICASISGKTEIQQFFFIFFLFYEIDSRNFSE